VSDNIEQRFETDIHIYILLIFVIAVEYKLSTLITINGNVLFNDVMHYSVLGPLCVRAGRVLMLRFVCVLHGCLHRLDQCIVVNIWFLLTIFKQGAVDYLYNHIVYCMLKFCGDIWKTTF